MATGLRNVLPLLPPILLAQWTITTPTQSLGTVRILRNTDSIIGTDGWVPPQDGTPWAIVIPDGTQDHTPEVNRVWATYRVRLFLGIENADFPLVVENYNDLALAWIDSARAVIAANRRGGAAGAALFPTSGDVRWEMIKGDIKPNETWFGTEWYGVEIVTHLTLTIGVNYQY